MSRRRASSIEIHEEQSASLQGGEYGGETEPSYAAKGSVYAKLFAKETRQHAAVGEDEQVEARENSEYDGNAAGSNGGYEEEVDGNGVGDGQDGEDDEEDDEYDPNDASDAEDSDESDDSGSDLDDEETSMRSLLLPMATYAKQLLFLSDEEDNGEFDDQDAELWESEQEKRAWIAQYEAKNREFVERYGCRIDSPAIPDVKRKLRRERKREAKFSIVLVVLAVAYFIRLMVGAPTPTVPVTPTETPAESVTTRAPETAPGSPQAQIKDASSPLWWTTWTENLVERVVMWPSEYFKSKIDLVTVKQPAKSLPAKAESESVTSAPTNERVTIKDEPTIAVQKEEVKQQVRIEEVIHHRETIEEATAGVALNEEYETTPTHSVESVVVDVATVEVVVETEVVEVEVVVESTPASHEATGTPALPDQVTSETDLESKNTEEEAPVVDHSEAADVHHPEDRDAPQQSTTSDFLSQCFDLFHKLIKTKNDPDLKVAAIEACDAAVQSSSAARGTSTEWIQAHVLRGDLKSLLYNFDEARADYEAALAHAPILDLPLESRDLIELKLAANRWIELYQTKQFKELRSDCQRVVDASFSIQTSIPRDRLQGVASDWLRVFKREKPLMDVLIKTRAWTINPLKLL